MSIQTSQLGGFMDSAYCQQQYQQQPAFQVSPQHIQRLRHLQQQAAFHQQTGYPPQQQQQQQQLLALSQYQQPHPSTFQQTAGQQSQETPVMTSSDLGFGEKSQTKEARRAEHNAIERARRESLNTKFQQLAHSLPNLQNDRRPSKGTIIERTLEFVKQTVQKEERYRNEIKELSRANRQLMRQVTSRSSMLAMAHISDNEQHEQEDDDDQFDMLDYEESAIDAATADDTLSRKSSISSFAMQSMSSLPTGSNSSTTTSPSLDYDPSMLYQWDSKATATRQHQQLYFSDGFDGYMLSSASLDMTNITNMPIKYEPSYPC